MRFRTDLPTAAKVYERAYQHASAFGCSKIVCHDDANERIGVYCLECSVWYNAPYPGPGQYDQWPWDLKNPGSADARSAYLQQHVEQALGLRRPKGKTSWDLISQDDFP